MEVDVVGHLAEDALIVSAEEVLLCNYDLVVKPQIGREVVLLRDRPHARQLEVGEVGWRLVLGN